MDIDKAALRDQLLAMLECERDTLIAAQKVSAEGVTHADARADGNKDMRATEASYIARGQAERATALTADVEKVRAMPIRAFGPTDAAALGAVLLVQVESAPAPSRVLLAPAGGGTELTHGSTAIRVITPKSPMGRAVVGARQSDFVELTRGEVVDEIEILEID